MIDRANSNDSGPDEGEYKTVAQKLALGLIRLYQLTLSPWIGRQCRFYPTCSHYAADAIQVYGVLKGSGLAVRRLAKCHPFHAGGVDLVPDPSDPVGPLGRGEHGIACESHAELRQL